MRILIFFAAFIISVSCLFEDQAGTYDWRQQYLGRPLFSRIDTNLNRLFVATDKHVLAAINLKNGNIIWRKIFETNPSGAIDHVLWGSNEIVVISSEGQRAQAFNYNHGFSNWEYLLFNRNQAKIRNYVGIESKQDQQSYYFTNGYQVCYVSASDKACVEIFQDGYFYDNIFENENSVFVIGHKDNLLQKLHYNSLLTSLLSKSIVNQYQNFKFDNCVKSSENTNLVCYSHDTKKILTGPIRSGNTIDFKESNFNINIEDSALNTKLIWSSKESLLIQRSSSDSSDSELYLLKLSGDSFELLKKFDAIQGYDIISKSDDSYLEFSAYQGTTKLSFKVISLKTGQERNDLGVTVITQDKDTKPVLILKAHLGDSKNQLTTMCFLSDYSLSVYNNQGVRYFTREEGLAYIVNVEMVDFPLLNLQQELDDEFGHSKEDSLPTTFYKRIRTQLLHLRDFITVDVYQKILNTLNNNNHPLKKAGASSGSSAPLNADEITRDEFNLNKLIVAVSSVGKIYGIYTSDNGRILWSIYLKNSEPFRVTNDFKNHESMPLFVQRTSSHFPYEPQCVLVTKIKNSAKTRIFYFNPFTGKETKEHSKEGVVVDFEVKQAFLTGQLDAQFLRGLVLFDTENRLHVYPEKSIGDLTSKPAVIYSTLVDADKNNYLVGYSIKYAGKPLPELWRINLEDENIVAIGAKLHNDRIHSHGKVLGDRSVLYKYLNPNLIGVVTTGQDGQKVPFINLYLVDTVTGSIVNSFNHKRCKGPVHIVHSENWFFYSYYNLKYRRFEVSTLELFEGSNQYNSTHFSSLDDIKPVVFTKTYIVQKAFDAMQITLTEKGISTKDVIVACQFGVMIEIPWILIDARRPIKMTEVEREENLLPYMPEIPLNYEFSLNYYNYVYNIRGITTAASGLESTSLVFAYGLDVYFTRVFPSKTFDMLREDFDYFFITTLMIGLLLGTVLSKKLASSSNLKKAWK